MTDDVLDHSRRKFFYFGAAALFASLTTSHAMAQSVSNKLKIGVIGSGHIGGTIGGLWVKAGHSVLFSSRHPEELKPLTDSLGPLAKAGTVGDALDFGDVILVAVPYKAIPELAKDYGPKFAGKIVIDPANAVARRDGEDLLKETKEKGIGATTESYLKGSHVVRAFNSMSYTHFVKEAHRAGDPMAIPIAGDDERAVQVASQLVRDAGFEPVAVPLARALRSRQMTESDADAAPASNNQFHRLLRRLINVTPAELPALGWCWFYIFSVLASYYILRPIRDQMGVAGGVNNLPWLFTGTLIAMLVLNVPFSALVKFLPRKQFISLSYRFFAASILVFGAALHWATPEQVVWIGRFFFIWISVVTLFVVTIFWSMVVDIFNSEQGKRLFGFIAAGATLGAIVGASVTASLAQLVQPAFLLVGAAILLEISTFCVRRLSRLSEKMSDRPHPERNEQPIGGGVMAGFVDAVRSPYLLNTAIFLLLYAVTSTFLYFSQASVVSESFTSRGAQTAFFATIDLIVNVITLVIQVFFTGRLVGWLGVAVVLGLLPALSMLGFGAIAVVPTLAAVATFQVLRRAGNYALSQPARQVLYTVVSREDRYKAKNFIDTAVYRAGDQVGAWSYALVGFIGWGIKEAGIIAIVLSTLWLANSLWLGKRQEALAEQQADAERNNAEAAATA